jgi:hypothetical protein
MAIALTLGLDPQRSKAVKDYFNKFKTLPPKGLTVSNTKNLTGVGSFETLLKGIIAEKSETQFVLVVHGFDTGEGLILDLATRGAQGGPPDDAREASDPHGHRRAHTASATASARKACGKACAG